MNMPSQLISETIYAIQHSSVEDLGAWEDHLYALGFRVRYVEAGVEDLTRALTHPGLTILLGGAMGVYDQVDYPFLQKEIDLLKVRLNQHLPTLGICLGAQLIAYALGAKVYVGPYKEIGWSKLNIIETEYDVLSALRGTHVLHWHHDTFDLPQGAERLASSEHYANQAFRFGQNILALQFHAEVERDSLEKWLMAHHCELRQANIDIPSLRHDNQRYAVTLQSQSIQVLQKYIDQLSILTHSPSD